MAVNALIDTWTTKTSKCNHAWATSAPQSVKKAVKQAVNWLERYSDESLGLRYRLENAFFSGSVKGNDLPFYFPMNAFEFLNGTKVDDVHSSSVLKMKNMDETIPGFSGVVSSAEYQAMVDEVWSGKPTPTEWDGYNFSANGSLIYWSAPDFTRATTVSALGKASQLC